MSDPKSLFTKYNGNVLIYVYLFYYFSHMEESVQNDTVASVAVFQESPVEEKGKKMGVYLLIFLLVFSLLGLTYFILKDNGVDVLESIVGGTANTEENITEESNVEDGDDTQECTVCSDEVSTDNEGW